MSDTALSDSGDPLAAARRHWRLVAALTAIGAILGSLASTTHETQTTAEARLAVGSEGLDVFRVPAFAVAAQQLAANYARFVTDSSTTQAVLIDELGSGVDELVSINASPIPESNVVRVEATATDPEQAVKAAQVIAEKLVSETSATDETTPSDLLRRHERLVVNSLETQQKVERLTAAAQRFEGDVPPQIASELQASRARLESLSLRKSAVGVAYQQALTAPPVQSELRLIQAAATVGDDRARTLQLYWLSGALLGALAGVIFSVILVARRTGNL